MQATPERRSSIPVAIHKASKGQPCTPEGVPCETFAGGLGSSGTLVKPHEASKVKTSYERAVAQDKQKTVEGSVSSASSTTSSFDREWEARVLERPTGFTGDDRHPFKQSIQRFYGPRLHITPSAEKVIMGPEGRSIIPQCSSPNLVRSESGTAAESNGQAATPDGGSRHAESHVASRKSCRPRPSFEGLPKRDFSSRELSIHRKPVGGSFSIFDPSPDKDSEVPMVPKIPDEHKRPANKNKPLPGLKRDEEAETLVSIKPKQDKLATSVAAANPAEARVEGPYPPRVSSLNAAADFPAQGEPGPVTPVTPSGLTGNVTFDGIITTGKDADPMKTREATSKIPESKSNRMIVSIRSMFRNKAGADKERVRSVTTGTPVAKAHSGTTSRFKRNENKSDSVRAGPKLRPRYSKLPDSVPWNKGPRNISAPIHVSPGAFPTPTSTFSIPASSLNGYEEDQTPSFARPTKSTRTRAAINARVQTTAAGDGQSRRTSNMTVSSGSPRRPARAPQQFGASTASQSAEKTPTAAPGQIETTTAVSKDAQLDDTTNVPNSAVSRRLEQASTYIGTLCHKLCRETDENQRTKYLKHLLSLQHSLNEVKSVQSEIEEARTLVQHKRSQLVVAENLFLEKYHVALKRIGNERLDVDD